MKNRGFSMVEVIIVVIILAVLVTGFTMMPGVIKKREVQQETLKLDAMMSKARIEAMNRTGVTLTITQKDDGIYLLLSGEEETQISEDGTIFYTTITDAGITGSEKQLSTGESLIISYDRSNGAFLPIDTHPDGTKDYLDKIKLRKGTIEKSITCEVTTGKQIMER